VTRRSLLAWLPTGAAFLAFAGLVAFAEVGQAASQHGPFLEISILHATQSDAGASIDPALKDLPQLTREQPFTRYNVYKLLDRKQFPLEANKPVTYVLPNGRTLQATLTGVSIEKNEKRYQLEAKIGDPGKQAYLNSLQVKTSENEPFFVGGQSYKDGMMFLELMVRP
jgi:hypothetical protein